jgi:chlorophyll synthase
MKSYTWFAPAWAFVVGCAASQSIDVSGVLPAVFSIGKIAIGTLMAGPLLTGFSQVVNEWCDRDVDAINQPERLIPSGKVGRNQVVITLVILAAGAIAISLFLGNGVVWVAGLGMALALAYSVPPVRLKQNGWISNLACALAYESLAWIAGHLAFAPLTSHSLILALVYGLGVHGIMTINDFKSVKGDRMMGLKSIPALYGEQKAAWIAVITINVAQIIALLLMALWEFHWIVLLACALFILAQVRPQIQLIKTPTQAMAVRYNIIAIPPYVWGMMAAAIGMK